MTLPGAESIAPTSAAESIAPTSAATHDLRGQVALVTGSTSGIGESVARRLVAEGMKVVLNSRSSVDAGRALEAELGDRALYVQADVADVDAARALVATAVEHFGGLDVLVNNAGTTQVIPHHELDQATPEVWRHLYETNVIAPWVLTTAALPHLQASTNGSVVNMGSLAGVRPVGSSIPYAASKAALHQMSVLLAATFGPRVRVNVVAPGLVDTPWTADWDGVRAYVQQVAPMQRGATPEDVTETVMLCVRSTYMTGQVLVLAGGLDLR